LENRLERGQSILKGNLKIKTKKTQLGPHIKGGPMDEIGVV
jgi:hypothetical protein